MVAVFQARPYLKVAHDYPTAKRTLKEVENYSAGPGALLSASSENRVWARSPRAPAHTSTPRTRACSSRGGLIPVLALIGLAPPSTRDDCASDWPAEW